MKHLARIALPCLLAALLAGCTGPAPRHSRIAGSPGDAAAPESGPVAPVEERSTPAETIPGASPPPPASPTPLPPPRVTPPGPGTPLPVPRPAPAPDPRALLLRLLPPGISDRNGWAEDIYSATAALRIPPTRENFCSAIAVIEQESSFQADPAVPGLSRIAWREINKRREKYGVPKLVMDAALLKTSPDGRSYKARIDTLKTERQMSMLFDDMISELPNGKAWLSGYNPVRTGGPMQVSVEFAESHAKEKRYPYPHGSRMRDEVFTRRGGVYFGVAILLDYPAPYSEPLYRFADFNAGRYSSRNAAFQAAVASLSGRKLALDGDLLRYRDGAPAPEPSATQQALLRVAKRLGFSQAELLRDLRLEKTAAFDRTPLYQRVFALAEQQAKRGLPREMLPKIGLKSPKIHRKLTTEWFAKRVDWRYRTCLAR